MDKTRLRVRVNPRGYRNQVTAWEDGVLHVKLTAPPVEGAANKAAVEFIADLLGVRKSQVAIVSGHAARDKTFEITGVSESDLRTRLSGQ